MLQTKQKRNQIARHDVLFIEYTEELVRYGQKHSDEEYKMCIETNNIMDADCDIVRDRQKKLEKEIFKDLDNYATENVSTVLVTLVEEALNIDVTKGDVWIDL